MRQVVTRYDFAGAVAGDDPSQRRAAAVGDCRESFVFHLTTNIGKDPMMVLNYWTRERKAKNGRWVKVDAWNHIDRHRYLARPRPEVPLDVQFAAVRAISDRIRMEDDNA